MYRIDAEFQAFLPALSLEELASLEADIRQSRKVREPLTIWYPKRGQTPILIDGHHRHAIIKKLKAEGVALTVPAARCPRFRRQILRSELDAFQPKCAAEYDAGATGGGRSRQQVPSAEID